MENENLDAYFMSDKQLMKMLVGLSEDTCLIEFIGHMSMKDGESQVGADGLPWIIFGKHNIDEELFKSILDDTEWSKWLVKDFSGPGTYSFRAIIKLAFTDTLEAHVSHGEVELIITDKDEAIENEKNAFAKALDVIEKMKNSFLILSLLFLVSCKNPTTKFKYRIEKDSIQHVGRSKYPMHSKDSVYVGGIWFTDHYFMIKDTIAYQNSDSSIVKIAPPFRLIIRNQ
jgi:hypothetical protein